MLETVAIPILLKAVDFLFGEGSKILEERRKSRKAEQEVMEEQPRDSPSFPSTIQPPSTIRSKEDALRQPVVENIWLDSEANIKHLLSLLEIHTRNYRLAKEQFAKWGSALVPPVIVSNLAETENEIAETTKELQAILSKVYGKKVTAPEVEQS